MGKRSFNIPDSDWSHSNQWNRTEKADIWLPEHVGCNLKVIPLNTCRILLLSSLHFLMGQLPAWAKNTSFKQVFNAHLEQLLKASLYYRILPVAKFDSGNVMKGISHFYYIENVEFCTRWAFQIRGIAFGFDHISNIWLNISSIRRELGNSDNCQRTSITFSQINSDLSVTLHSFLKTKRLAEITNSLITKISRILI